MSGERVEDDPSGCAGSPASHGSEAMYAERIREIVNKLATARSAPGLETRFGVEKHQFRLRPPLPESELLAFERHHEVVLPDD
jgi:hypothetical protein